MKLQDEPNFIRGSIKTKSIQKPSINSSKSKKKHYEILSKSSTYEGQSFLGIVKNVNRNEITVSLTHCLNGFLPTIEFIRNPQNFLNSSKSAQKTTINHLTNLLLNKAVSCVVTNIASNFTGKIFLTALPSKVNSTLNLSMLNRKSVIYGFIESLEEKGCSVDLGLPQKHDAFLSIDPSKLAIAFNKDLSLETAVQLFNIPIWTIIQKIRKNKIVTLKRPKSTKKENFANFDQIRPGSLVTCDIVARFANGVKVVFSDIFYGVIDNMNGSDTLLKESSITAIIVFVDYRQKKVILSTKEHLFSFHKTAIVSPPTKTGEIFNDAMVTSSDALNGIFLTKSVEGDLKLPLYCHQSKLSDKETGAKTAPSQFKKGKTAICRVYDYSAVCRFHLVTVQKAQIRSKIFCIENLRPGQLIQVVLLSFQNYGLLVSLDRENADNPRPLKGVIPNNHLADFPIIDPKKKFEIGDPIECRVLNIDSTTKKAFLSAKKTLIESDLPIIDSDSPEINLVTHGTISNVYENGVYVCFYNNTYGYLPSHEIKKSGYKESAIEIFHVGQPIKVRVDSVKPRTVSNSKTIDNPYEKTVSSSAKRIFLSLDLTKKSPVNQDWSKISFVDGSLHLSVGDIVSAKTKLLLDKKAQLVIETKGSGKILGELFYPHLHDDYEKSVLSRSQLRCEGTLNDLMVLFIKENGTVLLTAKKSFLLLGKTMPKHNSEVVEGKVYIGSVKNSAENGIVVGFLGSSGCFVPKSLMPPNLVDIEDFDSKYPTGMSVAVKIKKAENNEKIVGSILAEDLLPDSKETMKILFPPKSQKNSKEDETRIVTAKIAKIEKGKITLNVENGHQNVLIDPKTTTTKLNAENVSANSLNVNDSLKVTEIHSERNENGILKIFSRPNPNVIEEKTIGNFEIRLKLEECVVAVSESLKSVGVIPKRYYHIDFEEILRLDEGARIECFVVESNWSHLLLCPTMNSVSKGLSASVRGENGEFRRELSSVSLEGVVQKVVCNGLVIELKKYPEIPSFIHFSEIGNDLSILKKLNDHIEKNSPFDYVKGTKVKAILMKSGGGMGPSLLSLRRTPPNAPEKTSVEPISFALAKNVFNGIWLNVETAYQKFGQIPITCVSSEWKDNPFDDVLKQKYVRIYPLDSQSNPPLKMARKSLYSLVPKGNFEKSSVRKQMNGRYEIGDIVRGFVKSVDQKRGLFLSLSPDKDALVYKNDLSDGFIEDISAAFSIGKVLKGKIISIEGERVRVTLKRSETDQSLRQFSEFSEGEEVRGTIQNVQLFGLFVRIEKSAVTALCHISQVLNDGKFGKEDLLEHYRSKVNQKCNFRIAKIDDLQKRISLTMRNTDGDRLSEGKKKDLPQKYRLEEFVQLNETEGEESEEENNDLVRRFCEAPREVNGTDQIAPEDTVLKELTESTDRNPTNPTPWMDLMSFHSKSSDFDKARETAKRAIKAIPFESKQDRLAIWMNWLSLEIDVGDCETFTAVMKDCVQRSDCVEAYRQVIRLLVQKERFRTANTMFSHLISQDKRDIASWVAYAKFLFKHSGNLPAMCVMVKEPFLAPEKLSKTDSEGERNIKELLRRALQIFDSNRRVDLLTRFAKAEFIFGDKENARKTLDDIVDTFPSSAKAHNALIEAEIEGLGAGDEDGTAETQLKEESKKRCRNALQKAVESNLPLKKAKIVFSRYLEFAKKFGEKEDQKHVTKKAKEYIEKFKSNGN